MHDERAATEEAIARLQREVERKDRLIGLLNRDAADMRDRWVEVQTEAASLLISPVVLDHWDRLSGLFGKLGIKKGEE